MAKPAIVVHGGAWVIDKTEFDLHKKGMEDALKKGWQVLVSGGSSLDAVEETVKLMEDSGIFDAGRGSVLNEKGEAELDALIMRGDLKSGAVAALKNIANPISVARAVMEKTPHMLLVGEGAATFAEKNGFRKLPMSAFISKKEIGFFKGRTDSGFGTVGAVAIDSEGNLCSATSTGGTRGKMAGRVGDSPLIGSGGYCDQQSGGASATGHGESFMKVVACKAACDYLKTEKSGQAAAEQTIRLIEKRTNGKGGIILMRNDGDIGIAFNTPQMARGFAKDGKIEVFV